MMRNESSTYHTFHPDHLGSTSYVTCADGNVAQHVEYIPYGEVFVEERSGTVGTAYLFNAKELDDETGMYYYGARYLDPTNAMWISVDPMWEKFAGMSAYNYCAGNPVKMVDPDGRRTFNITDGDGESYSIDDGVDETINMALEDFDLLSNTFSNDNSDNKETYSKYLNALRTRPSFEDMEANYPQGTVEQVCDKIGGKVKYNFKSNPDDFENTCAIRMSQSLNESGVTIPNLNTSERPGIVGSGSNKKWFFYRVTDLSKHLQSIFGFPEFSGTFDQLQESGLKGIVKFHDCDFSNARGHFDLYNGGCVNHCYDDQCATVDLWILPK